MSASSSSAPSTPTKEAKMDSISESPIKVDDASVSSPSGFESSSSLTKGDEINIIYSSWLSKQPRGGILYQKRYFMLTPTSLCYTNKKKDVLTTKTKTTSWSLENEVKSVEVEESDNEHLKLVVAETGSDVRTILLKGPPELVAIWHEKLTAAGVKAPVIEVPVETTAPAVESPAVPSIDATSPVSPDDTAASASTSDESWRNVSANPFRKVAVWLGSSIRGIEKPKEEPISVETPPVSPIQEEVEQEPKGEEHLLLEDTPISEIPQWPVATPLPETELKSEEKCGWFFGVFSFCQTAEPDN